MLRVASRSLPRAILYMALGCALAAYCSPAARAGDDGADGQGGAEAGNEAGETGGEATGDPRDLRPRAIAVLDVEPGLNRWVRFSAELTRDPDERPGAPALEYEWTQAEGPAVGLNKEQAAAPYFWILISETGTYKFALRVKNAHGWSDPGRLNFEIKGEPVLPFGEALHLAGAGERIALPGEGWRQVLGPPVNLTPSDDAMTSAFRPVAEGLYLFEALHAGEIPERRAILVPPGADAAMGDRRPAARLAPRHEGEAGQTIVLDGSLSDDPDGRSEPLRAVWASEDLQRGVKIVPQPSRRAHFVAERAGIYRVTLTINDGRLESESVETFIAVREAGTNPEAAVKIAELPAEHDPLGKRVTLRCFESSLDRPVQLFPTACGLALQVDPALYRPEKFASVPLHLGVDGAPVRVLLDFIARQTDAQYRREGEGSTWLVPPGFQKRDGDELKSLVFAADALYDAADGSDLKTLVEEAFRAPLKADSGASVTVRTDTQKVVAVLPLSWNEHLKTLVHLLRSPKGMGLPAPPPRTLGEILMRQKLAETVVTHDWKDRRLDLLLRDLSADTGLPCGLDPRQFPRRELPRVTLKADAAPLRDVVRGIVHEAELDGCQPMLGGGLWFYRGDEPYPTSESLQDNVQVRVYDIENILAELPMLNGEVVAWHVKRRVYPGSWKDPNVSCLFHPATKRLVVLHGELAQGQVLHVLDDLKRRGEAALGPVLTAKP